MNCDVQVRVILSWLVRGLVVALLTWGLPRAWAPAVGAATVELFASPDGSGSSCTRTDPCTLPQALAIARTNGQDDIVTLAPGTYPRAAYVSDDGTMLTLRGRLGTMSSDVVLDAGGSGTPLHLENFGATASVTIKGLTLLGGDASGIHIYCDDGRLDVLLDRVTVQNNSARTDGGGINIEASPSYKGNGNAIIVVEIRDSLIRDNRAGKRGGGIKAHACYGDSLIEMRVVNALIEGNQATWSGGGVDLSACELGENNVTRAILVNSTVANNVADTAREGFESGGGARAYAYSGLGATVTMDLYNSIIYGNSLGGGARQDLYLGEWGGDWGRGNAAVSAYHTDIGALHLDTERGTPDHGAYRVINADPGFASPAAGDFHLLPTSPCVDRGTYVVPMPPGLPAADMEGKRRVSGAAPDMGAYELELESIYLPAIRRG